MPKGIDLFKKNNSSNDHPSGGTEEPQKPKKGFAQMLGEKLRSVADKMDEKDKSGSEEAAEFFGSFSEQPTQTPPASDLDDQYKLSLDDSSNTSAGDGFNNDFNSGFDDGFDDDLNDDFGSDLDNEPPTGAFDEFQPEFSDSEMDQSQHDEAFDDNIQPSPEPFVESENEYYPNDSENLPTEPPYTPFVSQSFPEEYPTVPPFINDDTMFGVSPSYDENADLPPQNDIPNEKAEKKPSRRPRDMMGSLLHRLKHEYDDDRKKMGVTQSEDNTDAYGVEQNYIPPSQYEVEEPSVLPHEISDEAASALEDFSKTVPSEPTVRVHRYTVDYTGSAERKRAQRRANGEPDSMQQLILAIKRTVSDFISRLPGFKVKTIAPYTSDDIEIEEDNIPSPGLLSDIERYVQARSDMGDLIDDYEDARRRIQMVNTDVSHKVRSGTAPQNAFEIYSAEQELMSMINDISLQNEMQRGRIGVYEEVEKPDPYNYRGINSDRIQADENNFPTFSMTPALSFESQSNIPQGRNSFKSDCEPVYTPQSDNNSMPTSYSPIGGGYTAPPTITGSDGFSGGDNIPFDGLGNDWLSDILTDKFSNR